MKITFTGLEFANFTKHDQKVGFQKNLVKIKPS